MLKKSPFWLRTVLFVSFSTTLAIAQPETSYLPGEILFKVQQPFSTISRTDSVITTGQIWFDSLATLFRIVDLERIFTNDHSDLQGWFRAKFQKSYEVSEVVDTFKKQMEITDAEPNGLVRFSVSVPNDANYPNQWNLPHIKMPEAWDISSGISQVIIAVIDIGARITHEDLASQLWVNPNEVVNGMDDDGNGYVDDINGIETNKWNTGLPQNLGSSHHGTAVASVCCARTNNALGIAGVAGGGFAGAQGAKLMIIAAPITSTPNASNAASIARGVEYARLKGAHVVVMSMEIQTGFQPIYDEIVIGATQGRGGLGIVYTAASGNVDSPQWPQYGDDVFPAFMNEVLSVGSIDQTGQWYSTSNYSPDWLDVVAPGVGIWVARGSGDNLYGSDDGTSVASPHAAGLAALILSLNSNLSYNQVYSIIKATATNIGDPIHTGSGVINAYQALLLAHAYSNKSMSATATASNNGRKIAKTSDGKWHVVYESGITSGGAAVHEIFYRNSSDGQNWSTPQRLSSGNEQNRYPCIAANGTKLYVVWQRKNDSTHDVHFSSSQNSGASWSSYVLGQTNLTLDPLPVIQTGVASNFSVMAIYRSNSGGSTRLVARRTTSTNPVLGNWSTETTVPGTGANDFGPALASAQNYWGSDANFGVAYATTSGQIHYRYYQHATGGWSSTQFNLSAIVPGSNLTHKEPSLAGVGASSTNFHVAWHRVTGSGSSPYDHAIIHRRSTGFDSWPNEYFLTYYEQQQFPALTALASNKVDLVFSLTGSNQIYKQRFNGTSWASPTFVSTGQYPSISTGNTTAKYVWTSGSAAPYTVQLSSEILSKESSEDLSVYTRSVAWLNDDGGYIELQMKPAMLKLRDGTEQPLAFARATLDSFKLAPDNSLDLLRTAPKLFSTEAESLTVEYTVAASKWESVAEQSETPQFKVQLLASANAELVTSVAAPLDFSANDFKTAHRLAIAVNQLTDSQKMIAQMSIEYLHPKAASIASLGHIYDFTQVKSEKPQPPPASANRHDGSLVLSLRVHPNPFNPATQLRFALPSAGLVLLRIFDVNGRLVREWREEQRYAGEHVVLWDGKDEAGKDAASGIYISQIIFGGEQQMVKMTLVR